MCSSDLEVEKDVAIAVRNLENFIRNYIPKRLNDKEAEEKMLAW